MRGSLRAKRSAFLHRLVRRSNPQPGRPFIKGARLTWVQRHPSFFINGRIVIGAQPYPVFEACIKDALQNAKGR